jgi:hypothetical protein
MRQPAPQFLTYTCCRSTSHRSKAVEQEAPYLSAPVKQLCVSARKPDSPGCDIRCRRRLAGLKAGGVVDQDGWGQRKTPVYHFSGSEPHCGRFDCLLGSRTD